MPAPLKEGGETETDSSRDIQSLAVRVFPSGGASEFVNEQAQLMQDCKSMKKVKELRMPDTEKSRKTTKLCFAKFALMSINC